VLYIIDYGSGNLRSVQKAFEHVGVQAEVGSDVERIMSADGLVLPGVGAFGAAMEELESRGLVDPIRERVLARVPFLGVCLGLQLLFERSEEAPGVAGLGLVPGDVRRIPDRVKVPHMGWNQIEIAADSDLFEGVPDHTAFYFVHSYVVVPVQPGNVLTTTEYGDFTFVSGVQTDTLAAFQFHPEKSSTLGLRIYQNFAARVAAGA
jgi:glutamine amidotransferase